MIKPDVPAPTELGVTTKGWTFNLHDLKVNRACSKMYSHNSWSDRAAGALSRGSLDLYSTEELATEALCEEIDLEAIRNKEKVRKLSGASQFS